MRKLRRSRRDSTRHIALSESDEVVFVVTGGDEDRACAEYILDLVNDVKADPDPYLHRVRKSDSARDLEDSRAKGRAGIHPDDIDRCCVPNQYDFSLVVHDCNGVLTVAPCPP